MNEHKNIITIEDEIKEFSDKPVKSSALYKTVKELESNAVPNTSGVSNGKVLTKTSSGASWQNAPSGLPTMTSKARYLLSVNQMANAAEWVKDRKVVGLELEFDFATSGYKIGYYTFDELKNLAERGYVLLLKLNNANDAQDGVAVLWLSSISSMAGKGLTDLSVSSGALHGKFHSISFGTDLIVTDTVSTF